MTRALPLLLPLALTGCTGEPIPAGAVAILLALAASPVLLLAAASAFVAKSRR